MDLFCQKKKIPVIFPKLMLSWNNSDTTIFPKPIDKKYTNSTRDVFKGAFTTTQRLIFPIFTNHELVVFPLTFGQLSFDRLTFGVFSKQNHWSLCNEKLIRENLSNSLSYSLRKKKRETEFLNNFFGKKSAQYGWCNFLRK